MTFILEQPIYELLGKSLKEIVLFSYRDGLDAGSIMNLCHIGEKELEEILPRSLWTGLRHTKCRHCRGSGFVIHVVPWENDDWYRPELELQK